MNMQGLEPKEAHTICLANLSQHLRLSQSMCPRREGLNNLVFRECFGNPFPTRSTQNLLRSSFSVSEQEDMHIVKRRFVAHGPLVNISERTVTNLHYQNGNAILSIRNYCNEPSVIGMQVSP